MAFALAVGDVVVLLSFSAQARGVRLYEVENVQRAILQSRNVLANIKVNFQKSFQSCTY